MIMKKWCSLITSMIIVFIISYVAFDLFVNMSTTSYLIILMVTILVCVINESKRMEIPVFIASNLIAFIIVKYIKVRALPEGASACHV